MPDSKEAFLLRNLIDAGCDEHTIKWFLQYRTEGRVKKQKRLLSRHRASLLVTMVYVTSVLHGLNTISTIEELQPDAKVLRNGLSVLRNDAEMAEPVVISWLTDLGY